MILFYCYYSFNDIFLLEFVFYLKDKGVGIISVLFLFMGFFFGLGYLDWYFVFLELKVFFVFYIFIFFCVFICNGSGC